MDGKVTPPVGVLVPVTEIATLPGADETATLPKFRSTVFVIVIGVIIVADELAVAVACANKSFGHKRITIVKVIRL